MKRYWISVLVAVSATLFMFYQNNGIAQQAQVNPSQAAPGARPEVAPGGAPAGGLPEAKPEAGTAKAVEPVTIQTDMTALNNGGVLSVTGSAPAGKPVYLEVWAEDAVRASRFDASVDKDTGKRPYILYMTEAMPAYYRIYTPGELKGTLENIKKLKGDWSASQAIKDLGAEAAYSVPARIKIDRYQATLLGSVVGSRGDLLPAMEEKENRRRSMQLVKARFRDPAKVFMPNVEVKPDGTFSAKVNIDGGSAPGKYFIRAVADKDVKSRTITVENNISFPNIYFSNAGTSINFFGPFLLTLAIAIFGVLMGAGGGFILNPLLVSLWPLPHTVVAGTVMPTVAFSQASGIVNYSKIKFINWKLGTTIGLSMVLGAFIGPKLTELVSLSQYKFIFGWILIVLAGLMFWQTMPAYLAKNKKEQAILKEFKKKAEEKTLRPAVA